MEPFGFDENDNEPESSLGRLRVRVCECVDGLCERLATRPRGQQLLRQMDRLLEAVEATASYFGRRDDEPPPSRGLHLGVQRSPPMHVRTGGLHPLMLSILPITLMVGPPFLLAVLLLLLPVMRVLAPAVVGAMLLLRWTGDARRRVRHTTPPAVRWVFWIRKQRRHLRALRFAGLRATRAGNEEPPSTAWTRLVFWPTVTVMAVMGQLLGLGNPHYFTPPAAASPRRRPNADEREDEQASPRKRKMNERDETTTTTSSGEGSSSDSSGDEGLEGEEAEDEEDPLHVFLRQEREMAFFPGDDILSPRNGRNPQAVLSGLAEEMQEAAAPRPAAEEERLGGPRRSSLLYRIAYPLPSEDSENDPDFEPGLETEDTEDDEEGEEEGEEESDQEESTEKTVVAVETLSRSPSPSVTVFHFTSEPENLATATATATAEHPEADEVGSSSSSTVTAGGDPSGGSSGDDAREEDKGVTRSAMPDSASELSSSTAAGDAAT